MGSQGGGGHGGDSYAYYQGGSAASVMVTGAKLTPGATGKGGQPNGLDGAAGNHP